MNNRKIRFGVIGLGMMGREFAGVAARWIQLQSDIPTPEITGVCSVTERSRQWFIDNVPTVRYSVSDYRQLLRQPDIDAVYVATPHNLHAEICIAALRAGKHVICEKPCGIDDAANRAIFEESLKHPRSLLRCASQMIYFPGARIALERLRSGSFGRILEVRVGFLHESDIDPLKKINWKRQVRTNGEYGVMGDLAPHALLLPIRAGIVPTSVYAILSNVIEKRPDADGNMVPCDTWDNAKLMMNAHLIGTDYSFPMSLDVARIAPGSPNDWYIEIYGLEGALRYSVSDTNNIYLAERKGGSAHWSKVELGTAPVYPTITGGMAAFGFGDSLLQMWAAFMDEIARGSTAECCMKPDEARLCHHILTGALESQKNGSAVKLS